MAFLEASRLRKTFGDLVAVDEVSLRVEPGEILGLLGPNGAGKSTTMSILSGLLLPDTGEVRIDGTPMSPNNCDLKRQLGLAPQELAIYPDLTALENLRLFGRLYGLHGNRLQQRIDDVLTRTQLTDRCRDLARTYSGGMQRRLNFAIALLHEPRLLILDEPTVGVDPQSRSHLLDAIRDVAAEGVGVIYASHYMEEVEAICDRVAIIDRGRVLADDALPRLLERTTSRVILHLERQPNFETADLTVAAENGTSPATLVIESPTNDGDLAAGLRETLNRLDREQIGILSMQAEQPNLERLFLTLTGHALRD